MEQDLFLRWLERMAVVAGGVLLEYLGYRLFANGMREGRSEVVGESAWLRIAFSGQGLGAILMAAGTIILIVALWRFL